MSVASLDRLARFEVALVDLAKEHGFKFVYTPIGTMIWPVYATDGTPTTMYAMEFKECDR